MNWEPKQGEMITVWNDRGSRVKREFVAMAPNNKYICYTNTKHNVNLWNFAEPAQQYYLGLCQTYLPSLKPSPRFPSVKSSYHLRFML